MGTHLRRPSQKPWGHRHISCPWSAVLHRSGQGSAGGAEEQDLCLNSASPRACSPTAETGRGFVPPAESLAPPQHASKAALSTVPKNSGNLSKANMQTWIEVPTNAITNGLQIWGWSFTILLKTKKSIFKCCGRLNSITRDRRYTLHVTRGRLWSKRENTFYTALWKQE